MTYDFDDFLECSPEELSILDRIADGELINRCPIVDGLMAKTNILDDDYQGKPMMPAMVTMLWQRFKETYPEKFTRPV